MGKDKERILYYSTNRNLKTSSIKPFKDLLTFKEVLLRGQAPDEGLFMPNRIPRISIREVLDLKEKPYSEAAFLIGRAFLLDEVPDEALREICEDAYNFPVPIEHIYDTKFVIRLDQGPTASFKDFAARMMARLMNFLRDKEEQLNILVATSGDTGSAVGEAFKGIEGINVYILYPKNEVSERQKRQLDTIGENVQSLSILGKFDNCQDLVKRAFSDPSLHHLHLTSANSINFGRILPQIIYYVFTYAKLANGEEDIVFSVPSGNFGNALGCEFARRMGLPVRCLVMPTNENDEFPRFLETGKYQKVSPSRACLSSAMNVGHPSNLARFFDLYGGTVDKTGHVHKYPPIEEMRQHIYSVSVSDAETRETIKTAYKDYHLLLEPHGAVGWRGLERYLEDKGDSGLCVSVETAHPAKFPDEILSILGFIPEPPEALRDIDKRPGKTQDMPNDYNTFKEYLMDTLRR